MFTTGDPLRVSAKNFQAKLLTEYPTIKERSIKVYQLENEFSAMYVLSNKS